MLHEQVNSAYCYRIFQLRSSIICSRFKLSHSLLWETGVPGTVQHQLSTQYWLWNNHQSKWMSVRDKNYTYFKVLRHNVYVYSIILYPFSSTEGFHNNEDTQIHSYTGCSLLFNTYCFSFYHDLWPELPPNTYVYDLLIHLGEKS